MTMPWSEVCMHLRVSDQVMEVELREHGAQLIKEGRVFSSPITWGEAGIYTDSTTGKPYAYNAEKVAA
ncbi:hypothetical protein [Actinacidiphila sp. ITFR-21]|uniref:hypothetical protein n=1 Tax=Actinacidiphila sp. ITFR-21 TaxID=3075199 RepID=UPI00288BFDCA|nr:hypothetical protein [Streptomyces sp. ITFR-21]WNI17673.1 hypothetical protein RLT57_20500 [Streptomyces sp. ITFR-21]WNI17813.1 hypothetical protein RLT57_21215 [Streptomyces sp. ITFR-21]